MRKDSGQGSLVLVEISALRGTIPDRPVKAGMLYTEAACILNHCGRMLHSIHACCIRLLYTACRVVLLHIAKSIWSQRTTYSTVVLLAAC